jgi:hypothetical protein
MMMGSAYRQAWRVAVLALCSVCGLAGLSHADGVGSSLLDEAAEAPAVAVNEPLPADPFDTLPAADDPCMEELRRCCCCPGWTHYAIFDLLFLQRDNQAGNQPLVVSATGAPLMSVQSLQPSTAMGVRVFYGELFTDTYGWEVGYLGVYGMFGSATVTGPGSLNAPPPLGNVVNNFNDADSARATYFSTLNMAEFNLFRYDCCQECGPTRCRLTNCQPNCHCINYLAGFVWAGLDEQSNLTMDCCDPPESASYNVRSSTNYFGPQIGMRGRREWQRWAVEGRWKTAVCGTSGYQSADPIVGTISGQQRGPVSASEAGVGFIGNLNGTLIYRLTEVWGLRAGYNLIWLTNSTLAPTQYDFGNVASSGTGINDNGGIFLQGANLGAEARW